MRATGEASATRTLRSGSSIGQIRLAMRRRGMHFGDVVQAERQAWGSQGSVPPPAAGILPTPRGRTRQVRGTCKAIWPAPLDRMPVAVGPISRADRQTRPGPMRLAPAIRKPGCRTPNGRAADVVPQRSTVSAMALRRALSRRRDVPAARAWVALAGVASQALAVRAAGALAAGQEGGVADAFAGF